MQRWQEFTSHVPSHHRRSYVVKRSCPTIARQPKSSTDRGWPLRTAAACAHYMCTRIKVRESVDRKLQTLEAHACPHTVVLVDVAAAVPFKFGVFLGVALGKFWGRSNLVLTPA